MSIWDSMTQEQGQSFANLASAYRPFVGSTVRVMGGYRCAKKHVGKIGQVTWHGKDRFSTAWRYCDGNQAALREVMGQSGYCIRIQPDEGDAFFVPANTVMVSVNRVAY